ncbi:RhuM family protein [Culturomica massiliensis]|uniref:RhuM family protein n=1 Tax=Culturomica massiliensis TaxID=1841857 RepID=UPI00257BD1B8|nr:MULTISPECIES: RhuM family protein [Culturomica]
MPVVAKLATTANDRKTCQMEYYNFEIVTSVGYRVKSEHDTQFRIWANKATTCLCF